MTVRKNPMPGRTALALLSVITAALILAACGSEEGAQETQHQRDPEGESRVVLSTPLEKPAFTLQDTSDVPFDFAERTEGFVTLLFFGYTHCPDVCPGHMATLAGALENLPEDVTSHIKVVFVSADPARDTPERLREWLDNFSPSFVGLLPINQERVNDISLRALGSFWAPITNEDLPDGGYAVVHPAVIIAYTADNQAHTLYPFGVSREDWERDLPGLVAKGWQGP